MFIAWIQIIADDSATIHAVKQVGLLLNLKGFDGDSQTIFKPMQKGYYSKRVMHCYETIIVIADE